MFQNARLRDYLVSASGWVPPSFPVSAFDMGALISKALLQLSKKENMFDTWERAMNDLIIFDELNNTRDRILLDILISVFNYVLKIKNLNLDTLKKKIRKLKNILNNLMREVNVGVGFKSLTYKPRYKVRISGSEIRHGLSGSKVSDQPDAKSYFSDEVWAVETLDEIYMQPNKPNYKHELYEAEKTLNPTISGLRTVRIRYNY